MQKMLLAGRLGNDGEFSAGDEPRNAKVRFSLAVSSRSAEGESTTWYSVTVFGVSEAFAGILKKGASVSMMGELDVVAVMKNDQPVAYRNITANKRDVTFMAAPKNATSDAPAQPQKLPRKDAEAKPAAKQPSGKAPVKVPPARKAPVVEPPADEDDEL